MMTPPCPGLVSKVRIATRKLAPSNTKIPEMPIVKIRMAAITGARNSFLPRSSLLFAKQETR
jgi:hypothetical protein